MSDRVNISPIWTIVDRFYRTHRLYNLQYDTYERLVAEYVAREGMPREQVRLDAVELSGLLQFKQLERIRDAFLLPLKLASHQLFRKDSSTDLFDRIVNDIFHEISILKEEHYNVLTYDVNPESELDRGEQRVILDEVHALFPIKIHRIKHLFDQARSRLEKLLPGFEDDGVLIRSLFLQRKAFVADVYENGLSDFYRVLYGENRTYEGYRAVAQSFANSMFFGRAATAYEAGIEFLEQATPEQSAPFEEPVAELLVQFRNEHKSMQLQQIAMHVDP